MGWLNFVFGAVAIGVAVFMNTDEGAAFVTAADPYVKSVPVLGALWEGGASGAATQTATGAVSPAGKSIRRMRSGEAAFLNATEDTEYPRLDLGEDWKAPSVLWTDDELALRNGTNAYRELVLCILGEVYDVGTGKEHYAPAMGYSGMAGRDASRGFSTGEYNSTLGVADLKPSQLKAIFDWRKFYREHETYRFVGLLEGRFFDAAMRPTQEMLDAEVRFNDQTHRDTVRGALGKEFLGCNSKFEQGNPKIRLWCDNGYHAKDSTPVFMISSFKGAAADAEDPQKGKCVCATHDMVHKRLRQNADASEEILVEFRSFPECPDKRSQECWRAQGAADPEPSEDGKGGAH